mmetsp:Transcript_29524/g.60536  ORF Transcript_29524/g.60536 Transcript_29524/m.60536 type:complete len:116 (+) Transcript_29524:174-521(+)
MTLKLRKLLLLLPCQPLPRNPGRNAARLVVHRRASMEMCPSAQPAVESADSDSDENEDSDFYPTVCDWNPDCPPARTLQWECRPLPKTVNPSDLTSRDQAYCMRLRMGCYLLMAP